MINNLEQSAQNKLLFFHEISTQVYNEIEKSKRIIQAAIDRKKKMYIEKILVHKQHLNQQRQIIEEQENQLNNAKIKLKQKGEREQLQQKLQFMTQKQELENEKCESLIEKASNENSCFFQLQGKIGDLSKQKESLNLEQEKKEQLLYHLQQITGVYFEYDQKQKSLNIIIEYPQQVQILMKWEGQKFRVQSIIPPKDTNKQLIDEFNEENQFNKLLIAFQQ